MNYVIAVSVDYNSISIHNYNDLLCSPFVVLPVARVLLLRSELKILVSSRLRLQVILDISHAFGSSSISGNSHLYA